MELIISKEKHPLDLEAYFPKNSCFFDIETTGFSREKDLLYLIGLLYKDGEDWVLKQLFISGWDQEKELLLEFLKLADGFDRLINYNGNSFDLPFINRKLELHGINRSIDMDKSIDLYSLVKANKEYLNFPNLKLKTIEEELGFFREDKYSGYECIAFYKDYLKTGDRGLRDLVLKHNYDDLYHMLDIVAIIDYIDDRRTIRFRDRDLFIEGYSLEKDTLSLEASFKQELEMDLKNYNNSYSLRTEDRKRLYMDLYLGQAYIDDASLVKFVDLASLDLIDVDNPYALNRRIQILVRDRQVDLEGLGFLAYQLIKKHI